MTIRTTTMRGASRLALAAALGVGVLAGPIVTAPPAAAACNAGQIADPITGVCWSNNANNLGVTGTGGMCLPGRLGLCLGALQNSYVPGENLRPQAPAGPNRKSWP